MAEETQIEPVLVDKHGAAQLLGVSHRTIEKWVADHYIPFVKLGVGNSKRAITRFEPAALKAWVAAQRVAPDSGNG